MSDLDTPGVPEAEDRLFVVPPDPADLEFALPTEVPRGGRGDPAIHQDELEPTGRNLLSQ